VPREGAATTILQHSTHERYNDGRYSAREIDDARPAAKLLVQAGQNAPFAPATIVEQPSFAGGIIDAAELEALVGEDDYMVKEKEQFRAASVRAGQETLQVSQDYIERYGGVVEEIDVISSLVQDELELKEAVYFSSLKLHSETGEALMVLEDGMLLMYRKSMAIVTLHRKVDACLSFDGLDPRRVQRATGVAQ